MRLVADGLNNQMIAERLFLSEHTVHRHVANIFNKLSVSSRAAAVAQAARRGLFGLTADCRLACRLADSIPGPFGPFGAMTRPWDADCTIVSIR